MSSYIKILAIRLQSKIQKIIIANDERWDEVNRRDIEETFEKYLEELGEKFPT